MPKENPEWKKQLLQREPDEERPSLDPEALAPYKEKIKAMEKELAALDNFLNRHFDAKTKPQRADFVQTFKELYITLAPPIIDSVASALSDDVLERILIYMANRLKRQPPVMDEILTKIQPRKDKALELVLDYVETLHLGIIENKKKVLWQLTEHIGIKRTAAIFEEQDTIKERAYPDFLEHLKQDLKQEEKQWLESGDPAALEITRLVFDDWYENNKNKFLLSREKIHKEVDDLARKLDDKDTYEIIEKHLSTSPKEIFELMENQARISSG